MIFTTSAINWRYGCRSKCCVHTYNHICFPYISFFVVQCIINSSEKVSSEVLFAVLDEASEKTAFSTDIQRYPDYSIFGRGLPLLQEVSDTIACCSYLLERSLVGFNLCWSKIFITALFFWCSITSQYRWKNGSNTRKTKFHEMLQSCWMRRQKAARVENMAVLHTSTQGQIITDINMFNLAISTL